MFLITGLSCTLLLSAVTVLFSSLLGSVISVMKLSKFAPLRWLATAFIEIIRGTPLLLQLYLLVFVLPQLLPGLNSLLKDQLGLSSTDRQVMWVCIAMIINSSAYVAEIIRSGIQAVDKGQTEAARSLGMSGSQTMLRIVLPQAIKNIIPALCNEFVSVIKETSLASTFFVGDLMTQYKLINGSTYLTIEPLFICGVIYFVVTFTLSKIIAVYERSLHHDD
ncbi:MAG: amino acid ABC transporter permease [Firmicutes bacterium]|nr:amino acid ABC transporter permease [Bacillota bacterium]